MSPLSNAALLCPVTTTIDISGTETNSSTCDVNAPGSVHVLATGALINESAGTLNNNNFMSNYGGILENSGSLISYSLDNYGNLTNRAGGILLNNYHLGNATSLFGTGRITNEFGGVIINEKFLENYGTLDNAGRITNKYFRLNNFGSLVNESSGLIYNDEDLFNRTDATFENAGTLTSNDTITNEAGALFENTGSMTSVMTNNYGELNNLSGATFTSRGFLYNYLGGSLQNAGVLTNENNFNNFGSLTNQLGGTLSTEKRLSNYGGVVNQSGGMIEIDPGGTLINESGGMMENAGMLDNDGQLINYNDFTNQSGGVLTNRASLYSSGIGMTNASGGTLVNQSFFYNYGGTLENAGALYVAPSGAITGSGASYGDYRQVDGATAVDGLLEQETIAILSGSLSGNGTVRSRGSPLLIGMDGQIDPGGSVGTLTVSGDLNLQGTLTIYIEDGLTFDVLDVGGTVTFGTQALIDFVVDPSFMPSDGMRLEFLTAGGLWGFDQLSFRVSGLRDGFGYAVLLDENDSDLELELLRLDSKVPEPSGLGLVTLGLVVLAARSRARGTTRRRSSARHAPRRRRARDSGFRRE